MLILLLRLDCAKGMHFTMAIFTRSSATAEKQRLSLCLSNYYVVACLFSYILISVIYYAYNIILFADIVLLLRLDCAKGMHFMMAIFTRSSATAEKQRVSCACLPRLAN